MLAETISRSAAGSIGSSGSVDTGLKLAEQATANQALRAIRVPIGCQLSSLRQTKPGTTRRTANT